jgi:hypothetical protein
MYIVGKYKIYLQLALKQDRKACQMLNVLPVSKAHDTNKLYIFQLCTCM